MGFKKKGHGKRPKKADRSKADRSKADRGKADRGKGGDHRDSRSKWEEGTQTMRGVLRMTSHSYGFVIVEEMEQDVFVPSRRMNGAMDGDTVRILVRPDSERPERFEGRVEGIEERAVTDIVGVFERSRNVGLILPSDRRIHAGFLVSLRDFGGAKTGDIVSARITRYPDRRGDGAAVVTEILGAAGAPGTDIRALARGRGFELGFPEDVLAEARAVAASDVASDVLRTGSEKSKACTNPARRDLCGERIFTIDGA
ncbi:MAG: hypothetical protein LBD12_02315, partial [Clostridiales Family XIII bacterium]|nr:hypothetical protein [Clostridiales Family XIII bacterium]